MHTLSNRTRMAPRLSAVLMVLALLAAVTPAPMVGAEDTQAYTAAAIETWLEDTVSGTTVSVTTPPSVTLDDSSNRMTVGGLVFTARGITVGLNYLRFTFGTDVMSPTTVDVAAELDVLGKHPRFWCTAEMECLEAEQKLHFASVSDIKVGTSTGEFTPSLDAGDLATIRDTLNDILDASGLSVTSPGGDLTGISVVDEGGVDRLMTTWSDAGSAYLEVAELESKLGGMANTLASKVGSYLAAGEGQWNVYVVVNPDKEALEVDASLSAFGITAALSDFNVTFATLTASVNVATLSIGTATKTFTFSLEATVDCDAGVPSVTMVDLTIGNEHPGFRDFIADIQAALLAAIEDAFDAVVDDTGLAWAFCPASITVEDETVVLHRGEGTGLIEGDANGDGRVSVFDAVNILKYTVGLLELSADQMKSADVTDEGKVSVFDAVRILKFTVDPDGTHGVLDVLLWDPDLDADMIDPLTLV